MTGKTLTADEFLEELASTDAGKIVLSAFEHLSDGLSIFGPNFSKLYANEKSIKRFSTIFDALDRGQTMEDAIRLSVVNSMPHFSEDEIEFAVKKIYQAQLDGEPVDVKSEDGRIAQTQYQRMDNDYRVAISVDITDLRNREWELKEARKQAEAANASKSAFLANTSHEIRTPLNAILGLAQILNKYDLPPDARDHVASIIDAGKTLTALLNDVLDLSKIEAGKLDISPVEADLGHTMRRLMKLWRSHAEEKGLDLVMSFDAELPSLLCFDPTRIRQCVNNLMSNAIKFTDSGSVDISVRAKQESDDDYLVSICVKDTGIGIDEEALARLFQPFVQADASTSRQYGGTGLGLVISRKLAQQMGGELTIDSMPGQGSVFTFTFKAHQAKNADALMPDDGDVEEQAKAKLSGLRVLVVDDLPVNRLVATLFLRHFGCVTTEAENGVEALQKMEQDVFDIVLLDVHMPVLDGVGTIKEIRASEKSWRSTRVIALTAEAMTGDRERYIALGMNGYISKPINELDLASEMVRVLANDENSVPQIASQSA